MFLAVQPAFDKHKTSERKNFLSYSYILYKFLELLGYSQILGAFSLKGKDKLAKQDLIFAKIANELNWNFMPSFK